MNNPKEAHSFGKTIKKVSIEEWEKWRNELYHTIGNFTPVPWPVMKYGKINGSINMQDIHKGLDEIYDLFNNQFGTQHIDDLSNDDILSWYDTIRTIDLDNKEIVTFGDDLLNDVRKINRLIAIRGRLMMAFVWKNRQ